MYQNETARLIYYRIESMIKKARAKVKETLS